MISVSRRTYLIALTIICLTIPFKTFASPPPPVVRASISKNGRFLVVTEWEFENPNDQIRRIKRTTYTVMEIESFINNKDRLNAPVPFWSERWHVTLDTWNFWPMISDDGHSLILIGVTFPFGNQSVLKIYRAKNCCETELVRDYKIADLWSKERVDSAGGKYHVFTDASPQWFSGGTFTFSEDGKSLIYRNQWNEVLQIKLADGAITRSEP